MAARGPRYRGAARTVPCGRTSSAPRAPGPEGLRGANPRRPSDPASGGGPPGPMGAASAESASRHRSASAAAAQAVHRLRAGQSRRGRLPSHGWRPQQRESCFCPWSGRGRDRRRWRRARRRATAARGNRAGRPASWTPPAHANYQRWLQRVRAACSSPAAMRGRVPVPTVLRRTGLPPQRRPAPSVLREGWLAPQRRGPGATQLARASAQASAWVLPPAPEAGAADSP